MRVSITDYTSLQNAWSVHSLIAVIESFYLQPVRAMLHDPKEYPDPMTFKPERYIKGGRIDTSIRDPLTIAFGFGRRHVAL